MVNATKNLPTPWNDDNWYQDLRQSLRTYEDLLSIGISISSRDFQKLSKYKFLIPRYYAQIIDKDDLNCPIRRMAVPDKREIERDSSFEDFSVDPLLDRTMSPVAGITHRYKNRILFHLTPHCSMYCRHCFRKNMINAPTDPFYARKSEPLFVYLKEHPSIDEVIFTGGDPLLIGNEILEKFLLPLDTLHSIKRIRIHTRVFVTLPSRINRGLISLLEKLQKPITFVTHFNHTKELQQESIDALKVVRGFISHVTLLNQSVLLKGVNDNPHAHVELYQDLFDKAGVLPYYLHHPDKAIGTEHFWVSYEKGLRLYGEIRKELPGYLVPKYVVDTVDRAFKPLVMEVF